MTDPQHEMLTHFNVDVPRRKTILRWASMIERDEPVATETDTDQLYLCQVRRWLRGCGPPARGNGAVQAAWSDVVAALA